MKINQKKLARQLEVIDKWMVNGCCGTLEAVTGFGKTYVMILIIQRFHKKYPQYAIDIVVPSIPLLESWKDPINGHIVTHGLSNVEVYVVNTYVRFERRFPAILFIDEIHNFAGDVFGTVFKIAGIPKVVDRILGKGPFIMGLTATLERNDGKHSFIEEYCPIIDTVSIEEAKKEGYISKFKTYNWGLEFTDEEQEEYNVIDATFRSAFAKFNHNFDLAMACAKAGAVYSKVEVPVKRQVMRNGNPFLIEEMTVLMKTAHEWQAYYAHYNGWDGNQDHPWSPKNVSRIAQQFSSCMRSRKTMIYKAKIKIVSIELIANKFPESKIITFGEDTEFADMVADRLGPERCIAYHSKIKGIVKRITVIDKKGHSLYKDKKIGKDAYKKSILEDFKILGSWQVLATVKAVDEGYDNPLVEIGVQASYTSAIRQNTQRTGRSTRLGEDDTQIKLVINLYMKNSQEEKWLKDKQRGIKDVEWIDSIDEITLMESEEGTFSLT